MPGGVRDAAVLILVVEDDALSRKALACLLRFREHQVHAVASAEDALQAIHNGIMPQTVLIDVDLPGMNGFELAMLLARLRPQARMILVTAAERERFPATLQNLAYLRKPLDVERLLQMLEPRPTSEPEDCTCHQQMPLEGSSPPRPFRPDAQ
jgi:CheY-like chemotaxis protein